MLDDFVYYHSFTMEVSLLQIINTEILSKTTCSCVLLFNILIEFFLQFNKDSISILPDEGI